MKPLNEVTIEYIGDKNAQWAVSRLNDDGTADTVFYNTIDGVIQRVYNLITDIASEVKK